MFIKKTIFILLSILFFVLPQNVKAQVLFNDNFDDGNSDGWSIPRNTCSSTWVSSSNKYGILTNGCITESIPSSLTIPESSDYTFEVDMSMPLSLNDRNFVFKYKDSNNWYGIHTYQDLFFVQKVVGGQEYFLDNRSVNYDFSIDQTYKFKVVVINNSRYDVYINDSFQVSVYDNSPYFQNFSAGLQASGISQVWFDNIVVTEIPSTTPSPSPTVEPTATPTPTPTPTPTVTPSATPAITPMPVPNLKQYSLPWKNKIYDHTKRSIQEFGCALTSAAMVLRYHGHQIMPDSLNDWLNQQSDGYLGNGLVNWLAISRYTKIHDSVNSPTLEYKRLAPTNENLDNEINNNRPSILKENGHFVVATGKILDKYTINDPGYSDRNTLEPYTNSFLAINSYKPTHSDLSYMMFVTDPSLNLELEKSSGANVPIESYVEDPITSITDPNRKSGKAIKITLFEKPENGKYNLKVSGQNGRYELNSYLYDTSGKVTKNTVSGSLHGSDTDIFNITFENRKKISGNDRKSDFKFWFKRFHFFKHFWR